MHCEMPWTFATDPAVKNDTFFQKAGTLLQQTATQKKQKNTLQTIATIAKSYNDLIFSNLQYHQKQVEIFFKSYLLKTKKMYFCTLKKVSTKKQ